jgi:ABC-type multidrug transport system fused ATPase/permease subunit
LSYAGGVFSTADPNDRKDRKYSDRELIQRLLSYVLKYKRNVGIVFLSLCYAAVVGVIGPYLLGVVALNDIFAARFWGITGVLGAFVGYVAIYTVNYFSDNKRTFHMQIMGQNVIQNLRQDAFVKLQQISPSYFSKHETGRIMSYITNDVDALSDFVTFQLPQVLAGFVVIASIVPTMLFFSVNLTLVSLAVIPPLVIMTLAFQGRIQRSFVETRKRIAIVTSKLQEGISGVRVTQSLVEEERVSRDFDDVNAQNLEANLKANKLTSMFSALVQLVQAGGIALVIWYGTTLVLDGKTNPGLVVAFLLYMTSFFSPIIQLTTFYNSYQSAVTGLDRVLQVLDTPIEIPPPEHPKELPSESYGAPELEFDHVTFSYDGKIPVIKDLNLTIHPREVVAIVGPTGAGKSSIVSLILRFYDPQKGSVKIDGVDLRDLDFAKFRSLMSMVPQDPFLFQGSIMENIRYGREDASDEEVVEVAKGLGLDDFVSRLPQGYNTIVNESATNLSMGQKQMVCFARAILRNPKLLILDEATSGVDPITEIQIQRALGLALKGRTAIIIAHRLSTIRLANRIIVLKDGMIEEQGSFEELTAKNAQGMFAKMYAMQFQNVVEIAR